ncbi:uncharacterized protein [Anoplolepis gracilipes]|uniref:uncharacterized protein n=1 Tax=Anoplolepis gracilipes TaxID=354296 RepID=UPI003BA3842E
MHDIPYIRQRDLSPEITTMITRICLEVKKVVPQNIACGIQILAGCNKEAIAVAKATKLQFIRGEGFVFSHMADEGFIDANAGTLLRYRRQIDADDVLVFANVKKKHRRRTIRMLGNFVGYLFGSNYSGTQDSLEEDPRTRGIMRRFRQVEVEDDEWILIDRTVEGTLEEPWYEMPPAVFTQEGPIKVATSPMENLLIEHPSMSVYSVVSGTSPPVTPDTPPPSPDRWIEGQKDVDVRQTVDVSQNVIPPAPPADLSSSTSSALCTVSTSLDSSLNRSNIDELSRRVVAELQAIHNDRLPPSDSNNINRVRIGKKLRSAQERAQEVLQKHSTQSLKRTRMERSNKVRQAKGKRLRRQDRLRVCHSGANNNRKC